MKIIPLIEKLKKNSKNRIFLKPLTPAVSPIFAVFFLLNHTNNFFLVKKDTKTCKMKYFRVYMIEDFALFKKYEKNTKN